MSKSVKPENLAAALQRELSLYSDEVVDRVNQAGRESAKKLEKLTKATAPVASGSFKRNIATKEVDAGHGMKKFIWYVRPPDHRVTHLLVKGHATRDGGRTKADPFLRNALDQVLPEYEKAVEESLK